MAKSIRRPFALFALLSLALTTVPAASAVPASKDLLEPARGLLAPSDPGTWSTAGLPPNPDGRFRPHMTYAPELGLLLLFGGFTERSVDNDVYWMDVAHPENGWGTVAPGGPAPVARLGASVAWDPVGHRMLLFGGTRHTTTTQDAVIAIVSRNDLWELRFDPSGATPPVWRELIPDGVDPRVPVKRVDASMVYDPTGRRLLLYGGNDAAKALVGIVADLGEQFTAQRTILQGRNDVWSFDLGGSGGWTQLSGGPNSEGPELFAHQAVWDPVNRQMVVTGGVDGPDSFNYTWHFNTYAWSFDPATAAWDMWNPTGESPAMGWAAYGYASDTGSLLVARGAVLWEGGADPKPVYALRLGPGGEGAAWSKLPSKGAPHPLWPGSGGTVVGGGTLVIFGGNDSSGSNGYVNDATLSAFEVTQTRWQTVQRTGDAMNATAEASAVVDEAGRHLYVVGGRRRSRVLWDLDMATGAWRKGPSGGAMPEIEKQGAVAFDSTRGRLMAFGGRGVAGVQPGVPGSRWERLKTIGDAPGLVESEAVYDPVRDRFLLIGGIFVGAEYQQYFGAYQTPDANQMVFGLHLAQDLPAWRAMRPAGNGPARVGSVVVYDSRRDRVLLFGGQAPPGYLSGSPLENDVWSLDLGAGPEGRWERLTPMGAAPTGRRDAVGAYDAANDRLVVWGGLLDDPAAYALSFASGTPTWSKLTTTGDPVARVGAAGGYDAAGRRLVVTGGYGNRGDESIVGSRDTFGLALGGGALPAAPSPAPQTYQPPEAGAVRGGSWVPMGPTGAHTVFVSVSTAFATDRTLYAGTVNPGKTNDEAAGVWLSRDAGTTWRAARGPVQGQPVLRIVQSPSDPSRLYASTRGMVSGVGVYASSDGGESWTPAAEGLSAANYYALAIHPGNPDVAWAGADDGSGLSVTRDGGATWEPAGFEAEWVYGLATVPLSGGGARVLAATRSPSSSIHGAGRVFASDDLGQTWDLVLQDDDYVTYMFAVDPSDPSRVLLSAGSGIWESTDGGITYKKLADRAVQAAWLAIDPRDPGVVWAAGVEYAINFSGFGGGSVSPAQTPGLWRSTDGGKSFDMVVDVPEEDFGGVAITPDGEEMFAAGLSSGMYASRDGGGSWNPSSAGFTQSVTASVSVDAGNPNRMVAAAHYNGAYVSSNGGATWTAVAMPGGDALWAAAASPVKPNRYLGANYSALYKTENGGLSWSAVPLPGNHRPGSYYKQPGAIAFHPTDPNAWYVLTTEGALLTTTDNGQTFTQTPITGFASCLMPIAIDPVQPRNILVGDVCGQGVFRSTDGGVSFQASSEGLEDTNVTALVINPADPNEIWAGTMQEGVHRSTDGGRTWAPSHVGLGFRYVKSLAIDTGGRLYASTAQWGVYESDDHGATWRPVPDGMLNPVALQVSADSQGRVFAATHGGGIVRLQPA